MSAMIDRDRNGKLDYEEFQKLWTNIREYKQSFSKHDLDNSGDICTTELGKALSWLGFDTSDKVLSVLSARYSNRKGKVNLDEMFVQMCCRVKSSFESYVEHHISNFTIDEVIENAFAILGDGTGQIDAHHLATMLSTVGYERLSQDEVNGIMRKAPIGSNDMVDLERMAKILTFQDDQ